MYLVTGQYSSFFFSSHGGQTTPQLFFSGQILNKKARITKLKLETFIYQNKQLIFEAKNGGKDKPQIDGYCSGKKQLQAVIYIILSKRKTTIKIWQS